MSVLRVDAGTLDEALSFLRRCVPGRVTDAAVRAGLVALKEKYPAAWSLCMGKVDLNCTYPFRDLAELLKEDM